MILIELFISFLKIGAFSFGGGYASLPLIQNEVVTLHQWLDMKEFTDLITISQMTPGPIAINSATFVGMKIAGGFGALFATIGCILPSCILVTLIAYFYLKYRNLTLLQEILNKLRPAVIALIFSAGLLIMKNAFIVKEQGQNQIQYAMILNFLICTVLLKKLKMDPILVMFLAGFINVGYIMLFSYII